MDGQKLFFNGLRETNSSSFWKVKGIGGKSGKHDDKRLSMTDFLHESGRQIEEAWEVGPVAGFGVGCGVGVGMGMVGGVGVGGNGGSMWNYLRTVFGFGIGCGVGFGVGYGQGIGFGRTLQSLRSQLFQPKRKSKRPILVQI